MPRDDGHDAAEKILEQIEKEVTSVYEQAATEVQEKLEKFWAGFERRDAEKRALVKAGKMTQEEYKRWRYGQLMTGKRWEEMRDVLAEDLTNADRIAMSIVNGHLPDVYAVNANYGIYQIEDVCGIKTGFTLYDRSTIERLIREHPNILPKPRVDIPKDLRWNLQHMTSELLQGILQGESIPKIASRLQTVTGMNLGAAMRSARTAVTGAQNAGRVDAYKRAEDMGVEVVQEWLATNDNRTRESHARLDGEQVPVGEKFSNGCRYPGDPNGPPEEVYNCRCTLIPALRVLGQVNIGNPVRNRSFSSWVATRGR